MYTEEIFTESDILPGCVVGVENVNNLRYADETTLLAESESALQDITHVVRLNSEAMGLRMHVKKQRQWWYVIMKHQCENNGKWASPTTSKEVQISRSMDHRQW